MDSRRPQISIRSKARYQQVTLVTLQFFTLSCNLVLYWVGTEVAVHRPEREL